MTITAFSAILIAAGRARPYEESVPLEIREVRLDEPGPGELLVRMRAAGVCHSDLSVVEGNRPRPLPMALGHEGAGVVESVGAGVSDIQVGDTVVTVFLPRCGTCPRCLSGNGRLPCPVGSAANESGVLLSGAKRIRLEGDEVHHHLGVSAFSSRVVVDRRSVVKVGDQTPPEIAALLGCAMLTGGGAVLNELDTESIESVAIVGLGGVGLSALLAARAATTARVIAVDGVPAKRELALSLGADAVYSPAEALSLKVSAEGVVEAAGSAAAFETALEMTAPSGTLVTVGLPAPDARASISPLAVTAGARRIVGSYLGSSIPEREVPRFEALWRSGRLPLERLISHRLGLDDINIAMDRLAEGNAVRQVVIYD